MGREVRKNARGRVMVGWGWLHYLSVLLDPGGSIWRQGGALLPLYSSWALQCSRRTVKGLQWVLRVEHSTEASTRQGAAPCAQVFLSPLLALKGRLHHPNRAAWPVFPFQIPALLNANSCSLSKTGWSCFPYHLLPRGRALQDASHFSKEAIK